MSLIEEAAKRLRELRRSGIETPGAEVEATPAPTMLPVPEGALAGAAAKTAGGAMARAAPRETPAPRPSRQTTPPSSPARRVDLDLDGLRNRGYLTPDAGATQLAAEFRVVKRPIIKNALGKDGAKLRHGNLVMVTSALPGEGKTFTAVNLAMSIATEIDSTVLLVDGDVANPGLPRLLGAPNTPGLLDLLTNERMDVGDTLVKTNVDRLSLIPAGNRHARSTELLASEQMASLLDELSSRYPDRIIVFDSPPLLATTEARVLASHMGQLVVVVAAETTTHGELGQALATVESCPVVLMLLNKASHSDVGTYYGYPAGDARR